jgi:hypothetical protein
MFSTPSQNPTAPEPNPEFHHPFPEQFEQLSLLSREHLALFTQPVRVL